MARKTSTVVIEAEGRDHGKHFFLREMPASQAEKWAMRVFLALARGGIEFPEDVAASGMAGIAAVGLAAIQNMAAEDAIRLMDEMFQCVQIIPDPARPSIVRPLIEDDIEEVKTRFHLRKEVLALHIGFFPSASPST